MINRKEQRATICTHVKFSLKANSFNILTVMPRIVATSPASL